MLLMMIERGLPIDLVLTADTGMEFPEMYTHLAKVDQYLYQNRGLHLTTLRHPKGFEWLMFDEPKQKAKSIKNRLDLNMPLKGNGWPGVKVRWCTGQLKTHLVNKQVNALKGKYQALHYVGIAADEQKRCKGEVYPLVEWGITEYNIAMKKDLILGDYMQSIIVHLVGAVHFNELENYESCGNIIPNCGNGCEI